MQRKEPDWLMFVPVSGAVLAAEHVAARRSAGAGATRAVIARARDSDRAGALRRRAAPFARIDPDRQVAMRQSGACHRTFARDAPAAARRDDGHARSRRIPATEGTADLRPRATAGHSARAGDRQAPFSARPGRRVAGRQGRGAGRSDPRPPADHRRQPRSAARMGGSRIALRARDPRPRQPRGYRRACKRRCRLAAAVHWLDEASGRLQRAADPRGARRRRRGRARMGAAHAGIAARGRQPQANPKSCRSFAEGAANREARSRAPAAIGCSVIC